MNLRQTLIAAALLAVAMAAPAAVTVKTEQINPADPAWRFKNIPGPSKSDIAQGAPIALRGNQWEPQGADGGVLVNGRMPNNSLDLTEEALLANDNADGGSIVVDLGSVQPVAAVSSYSWHEWDVDGGARGPQVYTLYGSADDNPDPYAPARWTKIADVDTRPDKTGAKWNGQHGVFISDTGGTLGRFRYLMFVLQRTKSPRQPNAGMTGTLFSEIDVHTAATLPKAGDATVARVTEVTDVWVAFKTHFDIGYTDTIEGVLRKYRENMMQGALAVIDEDRKLPPEKRFAWMIPGWPLKHMLGPLQDPARKLRIEQAVREGSLGMGAIPFSLHTESEDLEDIVRGLGFASQIARQYGRPLPIAAKMTDVPCHSWVWPLVLSHAGVKFLQLGSNDNSGHLKVPHLFWWQGADGSRVLCGYTPQYGSGVIPPRDWPAKNYLAMVMTYDNQGPPSLAQVENLRKTAERQLPGVRVHFGTLDDFARAVLAENPELPVVRGDMPDTWIHGWMSMPIESKLAHAIRPFQPALDALDTQLRAWGLAVSNVAPALADAYEQSVLYSEHTFGPAAPNMGSWNSRTPRDLYGDAFKEARAKGQYAAYEKVFDGKRAYARAEDAIVRRELNARLDLLAKSVKASGRRIVVYNGLPWPRSGVVEVEGKMLFAEDVPANGYKTYPADAPAPTDEIVTGNTLETRFYRVTFDTKRGGISSLIEKKTGRELIDKVSPYALGQFLHERFDAQRMHDYLMAYSRPPGGCAGAFVKNSTPEGLKCDARTPPSWKLEIRRGAVADVATLTAEDTLGLAKGISIVVTLYRGQPCVDVEWRVTEKTADPTPEGGWLCFPFAVDQPRFLLGRLGGPVDPTRDIVPGANKDYGCLSTGVTIEDGTGAGVGLCPVDSPCVSLGEPRLWQYSLDYTPKKSSVFVNLYNNEWHTNFPEWQEGTWNSRVRIWPTADLIVPSWEARLPLLATVAEGSAGTLPKTQAGVSVSRPGVLVTAFGQNPDGAGTLLRVWDQTGVAGKVTVTLPAAFKSATPVDLRGVTHGDAMAVKNGKLVLDLKGFAPSSFVLK